MNAISTKLHGFFDYLTGLIIIAMPWLFGFQQHAIENWISVIFGASALTYSFCTDYALGFLEEIDFRTHLLLDFFLGIALLLSPWLFGFYDRVYMPFVILGILEIISTMITRIDHKAVKNTQRTRQQSSNKRLAGI